MGVSDSAPAARHRLRSRAGATGRGEADLRPSGLGYRLALSGSDMLYKLTLRARRIN